MAKTGTAAALGALERLQLVRLRGGLDLQEPRTLYQLLETPHAHFVLVEWPVRDIPSGEVEGVYWCDLSETGYPRTSGSQPETETEALLEKMTTRLTHHLEEAQGHPLVCLLPTLADSKRDQQIFNKLRAHFFGIGSPPLTSAVIVVADFPTWRACVDETGTKSTFCKEIGDYIWLVNGYGDQKPAQHWLTGGDPDLSREIERSLDSSRGEERGPEMRRAVHRAASTLLQDSRPGSLESRLRRSMAAPPAPFPLDTDHGFHHDELCGRLYTFLPLMLPEHPESIDYRLAVDDLDRNRELSMWHGWSAEDTSPTEKGLLAAGLLGFAPDPDGNGHYLHLRSPLFAWAVGKRGFDSGLWSPKQGRLRFFFNTRFEFGSPDDKPTGLDLYLDWLLDIASSNSTDTQAWLVSTLNDVTPRAKGAFGYWWKRIFKEDTPDEA